MKKTKIISIIFSAVLSILILLCIGCSNSTGGNEENTENAGGKETSVSGIIGAAGGAVSDNSNITITIPEGALDTEANISVKYVSKAEDFDTSPSSFLGGVEFGPSGTVFNKPVEVKMKLQNTPSASNISILCYDEENNLWYFVNEAKCSEGYAIFEVNHFSKFKGIDAIPDRFTKFENIARDGVASGKTDSFIIDSYLDYLMNEEHIMEGLSFFNGYWYKPCGVHVSGEYSINGIENKASLYSEYGRSNEFGNTCGLILVGSGNTTYNQFLKNKRKTSEKQDAFYVSYIVFYEMVAPIIEISASPSNSIKKGEQTMIWVLCYYDEIPMTNYVLKIPEKLQHFSGAPDTVKIKSDGMAGFLINGTSSGKDVITVEFKETDPILTGKEGGVYSSGKLDLYCDKPVIINGHITQNSSYTIEKGSFMHFIGTDKEGIVSATFEYNYEGCFFIDEQTGIILDGEITLSNVTLSSTSEPLIYRWDEGSGYYGTISDKLWASVKIADSYENKKLYFGGTLENGVIHPSVIGEDVYLESENVWHYTGSYGDGSYDGKYSFLLDTISIGDLFDFELKAGTSSKTHNQIKDKTTYDVCYEYGDGEFGGYWGTLNSYNDLYIVKSRSAQVTQTITVTLLEIDEN